MCDSQSLEILLQLEHIIQTWSKHYITLSSVLIEGVQLKRSTRRSLSEQVIRMTYLVSARLQAEFYNNIKVAYGFTVSSTRNEWCRVL